MYRLLFASVLFAFSIPALALYKCEAGDKITYIDAPCTMGKSQDLGSTTGKTPASDLAKANEQNAQDKSRLKQLETARHKREAEEEKQQHKLDAAAQNKKKRCGSLALKKKWSKEDAAHATGKKEETAKRKARRAAEKYELECG
ncbi:MAG: hypothetical protein ACXWJD_09660 [Burkholderiaceae bacterium]